MTEPLKIGDRVQWRSTRRNHKGSSYRAGTVLRVHEVGRYAFVKPDKGQGRQQHIALGRLTKIEVQS